jgi:uncharacterized protein (DUF433 family)
MIDWRQHLESAPAICHGQLCAAGTRVFVTNILDSPAEGATREEILASYPTVRPEHIDAAIACAAVTDYEESRRIYPQKMMGSAYSTLNSATC